jgi:hypothetical protein
MSELGFETRLERALRDLADGAVRQFDAQAVAVATLDRSAPRSIWSRAAGTRGMLLVWAVIGLLILAALAALATGRPPSPRTLLFIRDGDIFVAAVDGSDPQRIAEGHAVLGMTPGYIRAIWSPDAAHILAVRDRDPGVGQFDPVVEVLEPGGHLGSLVDVPDGDVPEFAWSPDGRRFAMQTYPQRAIEISIFGPDGRVQTTIPGPPDIDAEYQPPQMLSPIDSHRLTWSPDGRWIGYRGVRGPAHQPVDLFLAADGSQMRVLAAPRAANGDTILAYGWDRTGATATVSISCMQAPCAGGFYSYTPDTDAWTAIQTSPVPGNQTAATIVASPVDEMLAVWSSPARDQGMATVISLLDPTHPEAVRAVVTAEAPWTPADPLPSGITAGEQIAPYPIRWSPAADRILYGNWVVNKGVPVASLRSIAIEGGRPAVLVERFTMPFFTWFDVASG